MLKAPPSSVRASVHSSVRASVLGSVRVRAVLALLAVVASLLVADLATVAAPLRGARAVADVPTSYPAPSWWDGDCDANHWNAQARSVGWTGAGAHRLGAVYMGIPVCGPGTIVGAPDVWWKRAGWGELEWECVEYAQRFMVQVYGVNPYQGNGVDVVRNYTASKGGGLVTVANGTPGRAPAPGDIVSFASPTNQYGHVAVVASSSVDGNGNGSVRLLSQNDTSDGWRTLSVSNWKMAAFGSLAPYGWLHDPLGRGGGGLSDGSFVSYQGAVYRLAGGAPVYVSSWTPFGGAQPTIALTDAQWSSLRSLPRDGSYLREPTTGKIYRVAGGAALYLSSCASPAFSGCSASTDVDPAAIANASAGGVWNHLRSTVADGTFVRVGDTGSNYGLIGRAAGGALLRLYDCVPLGGCSGTVDVNQSSYDGYRAAHPAPADGTVVLRQPSGTYATFAGGYCLPSGASNAAVAVDDDSVQCRAPLAVATPGPYTFVTGRAGSMALAATNASSAVTWTLTSGTLPAGLTLSQTGVIAGVATAPTYATVTVQVSDGATPPTTASRDVLVAVVAAPTVTTTSVPTATVSAPYAVWLAGANGTIPYAWTVSSGTLPDGLTLTPDGLLSGVPTAVVDRTVRITLTDASSPTLTATLTVTVNVVPAGAVGVAQGG